jgi:hypothetical protein
MYEAYNRVDRWGNYLLGAHPQQLRGYAERLNFTPPHAQHALPALQHPLTSQSSRRDCRSSTQMSDTACEVAHEKAIKTI